MRTVSVDGDDVKYNMHCYGQTMLSQNVPLSILLLPICDSVFIPLRFFVLNSLTATSPTKEFCRQHLRTSTLEAGTKLCSLVCRICEPRSTSTFSVPSHLIVTSMRPVISRNTLQVSLT